MNAPLSLRAPFDAIGPKDVLYFFDEPLLFTTEENGATFLCLRTFDDDPPEFLVVPTDQGIISRLRAGSLSLRSAFLRPWAWQVRTDSSYKVGDTAWLDPHAIPDHLLPEEGVGLYAHHGIIIDEFNSETSSEFLNVSFKGGKFINGTMPLGTLKALVDEVYASLRQIFAPVVQKMFQEPIGEATISRVLQIPVHQPKFESLSLSFESPSLVH